MQTLLQKGYWIEQLCCSQLCSTLAFTFFKYKKCYGSEEEQARTAATDAAKNYVIHRVLQQGEKRER